jgi:hypothetical protein
MMENLNQVAKKFKDTYDTYYRDFISYLRKNKLNTEIVNPKDVSEPIVKALENGIKIDGFKGVSLMAIKGDKGDPGKDGLPGKDGANIIIKKEKGKDGKPGKPGKDGKDGKDGIDGKDGTVPKHKWKKTSLSFEKDGKFVDFVDLKGEKGDAPSHEWDGTALRFELPGGKWGDWTDLSPELERSAEKAMVAFGSKTKVFTQLSDVPGSYLGKSGYILKVKTDETGLELVTPQSIEDVRWGEITGTLSNQTDLQSALDAKQNSLGYTPENVANKKTTLTDNSDTYYPTQKAVKTAVDAKVDANAAITGATKTKITYDTKGLVTAGTDATTSDIAEGTNLYYTDERYQDNLGGTTGGDGFLKTGDDHQTIVYSDATPSLTLTSIPNVCHAPTGVEFGSATQEYDISGNTWVSAVAGGTLGGIPDETNVGHKLADCLSAVSISRDNTYLNVREKTGAASATNPLTVQFLFTGITAFDTIESRSYYTGSVSHNMSIQLWNWTTSAFDTYASFSGETDYVSRNIVVFSPSLYIGTGGNAGKVILQFIHTSSGLSTHSIQFDYIALCDGGGGSGGASIASAVAYTPTGSISATNVQTAINELDTEKVSLDQSTPQTIGATGARLAKLWATDITCTNAIDGSVTGNAATVTGFSPTSGKTLTVQKTMTLTAADDTGVYTFPTGTATIPANNQTMYIGTTAVAINRSSAALALTGITSIDGNAATVTTNANLTGPITSSGNATSIASQTGTGTKFVVDTSPTIVTPTIASLIGNKIYPSDDSTTAIQINKADGTTNVVNVDTTNRRVGIGTTAPTAYLHLKAGTATASTAPIKLTAGTVNTTPEAGAIEFDGTDYFISI